MLTFKCADRKYTYCPTAFPKQNPADLDHRMYNVLGRCFSSFRHCGLRAGYYACPISLSVFCRLIDTIALVSLHLIGVSVLATDVARLQALHHGVILLGDK